MIRGSIINSQRIKGGAGFSKSACMRLQINLIYPSIAMHSISGIDLTSSCPEGYRIPEHAMLYPIDNGGMSAYSSLATIDTTVTIIGDGYMTGNESVTFTVSADGDLLANISGNVTLTVTALCEVLGYGYMTGSADISAQPTAADIAGEVFATFIDGSFTMRDVMKVLAAVAAGKTTITDLGSGNATVTFRNLEDNVDRVEADMTGSERTNVTIST
jgi:hypothetical protein